MHALARKVKVESVDQLAKKKNQDKEEEEGCAG